MERLAPEPARAQGVPEEGAACLADRQCASCLCPCGSSASLRAWMQAASLSLLASALLSAAPALLTTGPCMLLQIKQKQQEEAALKNAETRAKAEARITSALEQNKQILIKKREDFDAKQAHNEERRK